MQLLVEATRLPLQAKISPVHAPSVVHKVRTYLLHYYLGTYQRYPSHPTRLFLFPSFPNTPLLARQSKTFKLNKGPGPSVFRHGKERKKKVLVEPSLRGAFSLPESHTWGTARQKGQISDA